MKFSSIVSESEFARIRELAPATLGAAPMPGAAPGATPAQTTPIQQQDPQAAAKMQAQQALDRANRKKQIQDEIKQTQTHLQELQKELATLR